MQRFEKDDCLILKSEYLGYTIRAWRGGDLQIQIGASCFRVGPQEPLEELVEALREAQLHATRGQVVEAKDSGSPTGTFAELMEEITDRQIVSEGHFNGQYGQECKDFVLRAIERGLMEWAGSPPLLRIPPGVSVIRELKEVAEAGFPPPRPAEDLEAEDGIEATGETEKRANEEIAGGGRAHEEHTDQAV